jgi:hypothetical protein
METVTLTYRFSNSVEKGIVTKENDKSYTVEITESDFAKGSKVRFCKTHHVELGIKKGDRKRNMTIDKYN